MKFTILDKFDAQQREDGSILERAGIIDTFGRFDKYMFINAKYISSNNDPKMHATMSRVESNLEVYRRSAFINVFTNSLNPISKVMYLANMLHIRLSRTRFILAIDNDVHENELFMFKHSDCPYSSYLTDEDTSHLPVKEDINPRLFFLTELNYFTHSFPYCSSIESAKGSNTKTCQQLMMEFLESFNED